MNEKTDVKGYIKNKNYTNLVGYIEEHQKEFMDLAQSGNVRAAGLFARYCLEKGNSKVEAVYYYKLAKRNTKLNPDSTEDKEFYNEDGKIESKLENLRNELTAEEKYKLANNYYISEFTSAKKDENVKESKEEYRKDLVKLLEEASKEGYAKASYKLAELYEKNDVIIGGNKEGNTAQAAYYYNRALSDGLKKTNDITTAKKKVDELTNKLQKVESLEDLIKKYQEDVKNFKEIKKEEEEKHKKLNSKKSKKGKSRPSQEYKRKQKRYKNALMQMVKLKELVIDKTENKTEQNRLKKELDDFLDENQKDINFFGLGYYYYHNNEKKNIDKAIKYYERNNEKFNEKNEATLNNLAVLYRVKGNIKEAMKCYYKAGKIGNGLAYENLAINLKGGGKYNAKDKSDNVIETIDQLECQTRTYELYKKSKNIEYIFRLAELYKNGYEVKNRRDNGDELKNINKGGGTINIKSNIEAAKKYEEFISKAKNNTIYNNRVKRARHALLEIEKNLKYEDAIEIAKAYWDKSHGDKNTSEKRENKLLALKYYHIARHYHVKDDKDDYAKNQIESIEKKYIEKYKEDLYNDIGNMYEDSGNTKKAAEFYKKGYELALSNENLEFVNSAYSLGDCYQYGKGGVKKDLEKAKECYKYGYERKDADSTYKLGMIKYNELKKDEKGNITDRNDDEKIKEAYMYFIKASNYNDFDAVDFGENQKMVVELRQLCIDKKIEFEKGEEFEIEKEKRNAENHKKKKKEEGKNVDDHETDPEPSNKNKDNKNNKEEAERKRKEEEEAERKRKEEEAKRKKEEEEEAERKRKEEEEKKRKEEEKKRKEEEKKRKEEEAKRKKEEEEAKRKKEEEEAKRKKEEEEEVKRKKEEEEEAKRKKEEEEEVKRKRKEEEEEEEEELGISEDNNETNHEAPQGKNDDDDDDDNDDDEEEEEKNLDNIEEKEREVAGKTMKFGARPKNQPLNTGGSSNKPTSQGVGGAGSGGNNINGKKSNIGARPKNQPLNTGGGSNKSAPTLRDAGVAGSGGNNINGKKSNIGTANYGGNNSTSPNYTNEQMVNHLSSLYYLVGTSNEYNGNDEAKVGVAVAHMLNARGSTNGIVPTLENLRDNLLSDFDVNSNKCENLGNYVRDKLISLGFNYNDFNEYLTPIYSMDRNTKNKKNDPGIAEIVKNQLGNNLYGILDKLFIDKAAEVYKGTGKEGLGFLDNFYHNFDSGRKYIQQATVNNDNIELEGFYNDKTIDTEELKKAHESVNRMYETLSDDGKNAVNKDSEANVNLNIEQIEIAKKGMNHAERVNNQFKLDDSNKVEGFRKNDKNVDLTNTQSTEGVDYEKLSPEFKDLVDKNDNYIEVNLVEKSYSLDSTEFDENAKNSLKDAYDQKLADNESIKKVNINTIGFPIPAKYFDWVELSNKIGRDRGILPGMLEYMKEVAIVNGGKVEELQNLITVKIDGKEYTLTELQNKVSNFSDDLKQKAREAFYALGSYKNAKDCKNEFLGSDKGLLEECLGADVIKCLGLKFEGQAVSQSQGQNTSPVSPPVNANAKNAISHQTPRNGAGNPSTSHAANNNPPPTNPYTNPAVANNADSETPEEGAPNPPTSPTESTVEKILKQGKSNRIQNGQSSDQHIIVPF